MKIRGKLITINNRIELVGTYEAEIDISAKSLAEQISYEEGIKLIEAIILARNTPKEPQCTCPTTKFLVKDYHFENIDFDTFSVKCNKCGKQVKITFEKPTCEPEGEIKWDCCENVKEILRIANELHRWTKREGK